MRRPVFARLCEVCEQNELRVNLVRQKGRFCIFITDGADGCTNAEPTDASRVDQAAASILEELEEVGIC